MDISNTQGESFYYISKKERRELKKQRKVERKEKEKKNSRILKITIIVFISVLVGFIGWWGVTQVNKQVTVDTSSQVGAIAPNFSLPATTGKTISLSDYKDKKNVLIYFHEGLSCDPCIQQIPELEKSMDEFDKLNVQILAVSGVDSIDKLKQSLDRFGIKKIPLLSYTNASTEVDYNLLPHSMAMGRRAGHTFVLVGTDGKILWRNDYWPDYGMMASRGVMFVNSSEIVGEVRKVLNK